MADILHRLANARKILGDRLVLLAEAFHALAQLVNLCSLLGTGLVHAAENFRKPIVLRALTLDLLLDGFEGFAMYAIGLRKLLGQLRKMGKIVHQLGVAL